MPLLRWGMDLNSSNSCCARLGSGVAPPLGVVEEEVAVRFHLTTHPAPPPQPHVRTADQHQARQARALQCAIALLRHGQVSTPRGRPQSGLVAAAGSVGALADAGGELEGSRVPTRFSFLKLRARDSGARKGSGGPARR